MTYRTLLTAAVLAIAATGARAGDTVPVTNDAAVDNANTLLTRVDHDGKARTAHANGLATPGQPSPQTAQIAATRAVTVVLPGRQHSDNGYNVEMGR